MDSKQFESMSLPVAEETPPFPDTELTLSDFISIGTVQGPTLSESWSFTNPRRVATDGWLEFATPPLNLATKIGQKLQLLDSKQLIRLTFATTHNEQSIARLYALPSDAGFPARQLSTLNAILSEVDTSKEAWNAEPSVEKYAGFDAKAPRDNIRSSLFAMFNSLPSPSPKWSISTIYDDALQSIRYGQVKGLKTKPFEYQRRSAAVMLEREVAPERYLDPYLQPHTSPNGQDSYYVLSSHSKSPSKIILRDPIYVDDVNGGILGEEMGTGKTLVVLQIILATKHYAAEMPKEHGNPKNFSGIIPSLMDICAKTVLTKSVPWTDDALEVLAPIQNHILAVSRIQRPQTYKILQNKVSRRVNFAGGDLMDVSLCRGTIVVVPPNLINQWEDEIEKHCEPGALKYVKLMDKNPIPPVERLLDLDLVLITRARFDKEVREEFDNLGRKKPSGMPVTCDCPYIGATRTRNCSCSKEDDYYQSPLMQLHWKRIVVDEGHSLSSAKTNTMEVASKLRVQSRWAVSGTPASSFFTAPSGVDIGDEGDDNLSDFLTAEETDLRKIGTILRQFLKSQVFVRKESELLHRDWPTALTNANKHVVWNFMKRSIVRHQVKDIENEVRLPPLNQKIVRVAPGYMEKMSMNLFVANFTVNAVTSERTDQDYMFHPSQRYQLNTFVSNLKIATTYWTAFEEIAKTVKIARKYLKGALEGVKNCPESDIPLLQRAIRAGEEALASRFWTAASTSHEMCYFMSNLPEEVAVAWSVGSPSLPPVAPPYALIGGDQLLRMQKYVSSYAFALDTASSIKALKTEGEKVLEEFYEKLERNASKKLSGMSSKETALSPQKKTPTPKKKSASQKKNDALATAATTTTTNKPQKGILKNSDPKPSFTIDLLPKDSPLRQTAIVGTASAKLSYLLDRILVLSPDEKIIVFYENDTLAYYLAESLDILGVQYLVYTRTLDLHRKSEYLVTFNTSPQFRIFLMDVRQATYGINLYSASRIFFLSPLWQPPSVEAQALKRAHRIGQTRPVFVETLVLQDTIEEEMFNRRLDMSEADFRSQKLMMDDAGLRNILSNAKFLGGTEPLAPAKLAHPQILFDEGRTGEMPENPDVGIIKIGPARNQVLEQVSKQLSAQVPSQQSSQMSSRVTSQASSPRGDSTPPIIINTKKRRRVAFVVESDSESDEPIISRGPASPGGLEDTVDIGSKERVYVAVAATQEPPLFNAAETTSATPSVTLIEKPRKVMFALPEDSHLFEDNIMYNYTEQPVDTPMSGMGKHGPEDDASSNLDDLRLTDDEPKLPVTKKPRVRFADD